MKEGLLQLLRLQEVDRELQSLEDAREKYPDEIGLRRRDVEQAQQLLVRQEEQLEELARRQRQLERELEVAKADLKEHEGRFAEVTTNREYDALQREIEACKARISECETQILEAIDAGEDLRGQVESERQGFEELRQEQEGRIEELEAKLASIQGEVDGVAARRQDCAGGIDASLLRSYERSRKRRGLRVAPVRKSACGACFRELPAQQRSNVRRNDQVQLCESCGAILVWDEDSS